MSEPLKPLPETARMIRLLFPNGLAAALAQTDEIHRRYEMAQIRKALK